MANITGTTVKKVIQELVVPELQEIKLGFRELKVEIKRLDEKIDSLHNELDEKINSLHNEMNIRFKAMDEKIDSLHNEMNIRFEAMDEKMRSGLTRLDEKIEFSLEFHDRLTAIEAKVAALASR